MEAIYDRTYLDTRRAAVHALRGTALSQRAVDVSSPRSRGGNGKPDVMVTDAADLVAERAEWGLDENKGSAVQLAASVVHAAACTVLQDFELPNTYDEAARVGEGAPRLTPAA